MAKPVVKAAAAQPKIRVADQNPLEFSGGGLPTDFDGTITEARAVIWNYDNGKGPKIDEKGQVVLIPAMRLRIARDGEDEDIISYYSAGDIQHFWPLTEDGDAVKQDENGLGEGVMFGLVGSRDKMGKDTNHGHFMTALMDAGFKEATKPDLRFLEGLSGHFDRIQQKKRAGVVGAVAPEAGDTGRGGRPPEILAMTRFIGRGAVPAPKLQAAPLASPAVRPAPSASSPATPATGSGSVTAATGDVDAKLRELIVASIPADGPLKKGGVVGKVMKSGWTPAEKSAAAKLVTNEWLQAWSDEEGAIVFDVAEGDIHAGAAAE